MAVKFELNRVISKARYTERNVHFMNLSEAYRILGLSEKATVEEVKTAYKKLVQKYSSDGYQTSDNQNKLDEITNAFDTIMTNLRMEEHGGSSWKGGSAQGGASSSRYNSIRQMINHGSTDEALKELNAMPNGAQNAEWNFLMGSAYYYKGWVNDALKYFETATRLDPGNREYSNALNNLKNNQNGSMPGNPYGGNRAGYNSPVACSCCDMCAAFMCMDLCCNCGGC